LGELIDGLPFPYSLGLLLLEVLGLCFFNILDKAYYFQHYKQQWGFFFSLKKNRNN
jgi:hypothetical protein